MFRTFHGESFPAVIQEQNEFVTFALRDFYDLNGKQATSSIVLPPNEKWKREEK
jgi:hypothetical protein